MRVPEPKHCRGSNTAEAAKADALPSCHVGGGEIGVKVWRIGRGWGRVCWSWCCVPRRGRVWRCGGGLRGGSDRGSGSCRKWITARFDPRDRVSSSAPGDQQAERKSDSSCFSQRHRVTMVPDASHRRGAGGGTATLAAEFLRQFAGEEWRWHHALGSDDGIHRV